MDMNSIYRQDLEELMDLCDSKSNYSAYRKDYASSTDSFKIPIT